MKSKHIGNAGVSSLLLALAAFVPLTAGIPSAASAADPSGPAPEAAGAPSGQARTKSPAEVGKGGPGDRGTGGKGDRTPRGPRPVFGEVSAVRGNVLQLQSEESDGLTRVILASDAQIIRDEKLKLDVLKPGMKVSGTGRQMEGTATGSAPMKVEVQTLMVEDGGMGNPFMFAFGGRGGPLLRGRRSAVFRRQNYSGSIEFSGQVKSVDPLVLTDDQGNPLPVVVGADLEVHQRKPRPIKEGDITAGARLVAMGDTTPDGLVNAHMVIVFGEGSDRGSVPGTITGVSENKVTVRPRFAPKEIPVDIDPAAKFYFQENLDLDSIQIGDTLSFAGKVIGGDAKSPTALVVRRITPADSESPQIDENDDGPFGGGRSVTATVKGKITAFDPLRIQTDEGREVTITVPGQISYARFRPLERSALKAGQKALFSGHSKPGGVIADVIVVNPSLAMGPGF